jgi:YHS domain-containing protein
MNVKNWMLACAVTAQLTTAAFAADNAGQAPAATNAVAVKAQTTCPVMGGAVDKTKFVDYDGKRIYVCCGGCIAKIKKDPAKYVKQLEAEGVTLDKAEPPKAK